MHSVLESLESFGQQKLVRYLRSAPAAHRDAILAQLNSINLNEYFGVVRNCAHVQNIVPREEALQPCQIVAASEARTERFQQAGESAIRGGELAFFVVAGGQGSRLGFEHPKGMFPAAPVSGRSLFQIHMEKVVAFGRMFAFEPRFVVMTSPGNHYETEQFLVENEFFGLRRENVHLFSQAELPVVDNSGDLVLAGPDSLFVAPDGHGGSLSAIVRSGVLDKLCNSGVKFLSYFQVDNPMVSICDSSFLGVHIFSGAEVSTKVIAKREPLEKLGNPMTDGRHASIVEYSDLPEALARKTDSLGRLVHAHGSIGIHIFNVDFVRRITTGSLRLPFHVAQKSIPCFNPEKASDLGAKTLGRKFEQFVFDAIPLASRSVFVETVREEEFAPLKNKSGEDSILSCRQMQSDFFKCWLSNAGFDVSAVQTVEIGPLFACTEREFQEKVSRVLKHPCARVYLG